MPFISTKSNVSISKEKEVSIKKQLGKAIELIPGKSESWLMCEFEGNKSLYFKGASDSNMAFVEVKIFGKTTASVYEKLTERITQIISEELEISPDKLYIKYEEVSMWGWNGTNF